MKTRIFQITFTLAIILLAAACGGGPEQQEAVQAEDGPQSLISRFPTFKQEFDSSAVDLAARDLTLYFAGNAWAEPMERVQGEEELYTVAIKKYVQVRYWVSNVATREISMTINLKGDYIDLDRQRFTVFVYDHQISTHEVEGPGDQQFSFRVPAKYMTEGFNTVAINFEETYRNPYAKIKNAPDDHEVTRHTRAFPFKRVAGYFKDFRIQIVDEETGEVLPTRLDTETLKVAEEPELLQQYANSTFSFTNVAEPGTRLSMKGNLYSGGEQAEEITVVVRSRNDANSEWRDIFSETLMAEPASVLEDFTIDVPVTEDERDLHQVQVEVSSSGLFSHCYFHWHELEVIEPEQEQAASSQEPEAGKISLPEIENVFIIVCDALRADMLGAYGSSEELTPRLDAFAEEAVLFEEAIAAAPYTIASVSSIVSGLIPEKHGVREGLTVFPENIPNLFASFNKQGFTTMTLVGMPFIRKEFGINRDADVSKYLRTKEAVQNETAEMNMKLVHRAIRQANDNGERMFCYIHLLPPHWPYTPPAPFALPGDTITKIDRNSERSLISQAFNQDNFSKAEDLVNLYFDHYKSNVRYADHIVGELLDFLKSEGIYENSLIIFTSDHGEAFAEHGKMGHSNAVYEEFVMVPLLIRGPGSEAGRKQVSVGLIDLFPTLSELFDLEVTPVALDGRSLAKVIYGGDEGSPGIYYSRAMDRKSNGHLIKTRFCVRTSEYKYIYDVHEEYFFNLKNDPQEQVNLINEMPVLAQFYRQIGMTNVFTRQIGDELEVDLGDEEYEELRNLGYLN